MRAACLALALGACGDDPQPLTPDEFIAPTSPDEVRGLYGTLGNACNDSFLVRGLTPQANLTASAPWNAAPDAPAGLSGSRTRIGWERVLLPSQVSYDAVAERFRSSSATCTAIHDLFQPFQQVNQPRRQLTNVLLELDARNHPYEAYPAGGISERVAAAPVAVRANLELFAGIASSTDDGTVYRDVTDQHLPMYVACDQPLEIVTESTIVTADELTARNLDPALCTDAPATDDGTPRYRCVAERGRHVAANACVFVVDGSSFTTLDGVRHRALFGGTLTSRAEGGYLIRVDRFGF